MTWRPLESRTFQGVGNHIHFAIVSSVPALMMAMNEVILDRIAFGGMKELEEIYPSQLPVNAFLQCLSCVM
jgi:hypothetical protein